MAVRSKELGRLAAINDNTVRTIYTCPAGATAIVKDAYVYSTGQLTVVARSKRAGVSTAIWSGVIGGSTTPLPLRALWAVLEPGDELEVLRVSGSATYDFIASGTELEGVAA